MKTPLTAERVRELLSYDPDTGLLKWRIDRGRTAKTGAVAGCVNSEGYIGVIVAGHRCKAHRVAWLIMTGEWPKQQIDHRDEVKSNNRWDNLRDVSQTVNRLNRRQPYARKQGGLLGVQPKESGRFFAQLQVNGVAISVGTFDTALLAHEAYVAAKRQACPGVL